MTNLDAILKNIDLRTIYISRWLYEHEFNCDGCKAMVERCKDCSMEECEKRLLEWLEEEVEYA